MVMACGVAAFTAGVFHLMTHAFFKALLFLGAGSVIHSLGGEQDLRKMGALRPYLPRTYLTMLAACLAIAAIPPFAGFWSKDAILWEAFASEHGGLGFWLTGVATAGLTSFYMFRLFFMTFHGQSRTESHGDASPHKPHESPAIMTWPLMILALLSLAGGWVGIPALWLGADHFGQFLNPAFHFALPEVAHVAEHAAEHSASLEFLLTGVSLSVSLAGIGLAWLFYVRWPDIPPQIAAQWSGLYRVVSNKYYVDEIYQFLFVRPLLTGSSEVLWKGIDQVAIDGSVNLAARRTRRLGETARKIQSGNLRSYGGWVALGALVLMIFMVLVAA